MRSVSICEGVVASHEVLRWGDRGQQPKERAIPLVTDRCLNWNGIDELGFSSHGGQEVRGIHAGSGKGRLEF